MATMTGTSGTGRRAEQRSTTRARIIAAARKVAAREGAPNLSLRGVAAEAGFAPAALYGYFRSKSELILALAAEDLSGMARAMRTAALDAGAPRALAAASAAALALLSHAETIVAASGALPTVAGTSEAERVFNGRLIAVLKALSEAKGQRDESRAAQCDVVTLAAALAGLALMRRSGRLDALGFTDEELLARLDARFAGAA